LAGGGTQPKGAAGVDQARRNDHAGDIDFRSIGGNGDIVTDRCDFAIANDDGGIQGAGIRLCYDTAADQGQNLGLSRRASVGQNQRSQKNHAGNADASTDQKFARRVHEWLYLRRVSGGQAQLPAVKEGCKRMNVRRYHLFVGGRPLSTKTRQERQK
jgi:hypothetical protein